MLQKSYKPFHNMISVLLSSWLCWITFTRCNSIISDVDHWRICLESTRKCSFNGLIVYTTVIYAVTNILYHLSKILFKTFQLNRDLLNELISPRTYLMLAVHVVLVSIWYYKPVESDDFQTEKLVLCHDTYMSATLTVFKGSKAESFCIKNVYKSLFWTLLFDDLHICIILQNLLIKLLLIYSNSSNVARDSASFCRKVKTD